jgi:ribosomal protein S27E
VAGLEDQDYRLSMRLSPRAREEENNEGLRGLLILRLAGTAKAAWRKSLRSPHGSLFCEPCDRWTVRSAQPDADVTCPSCGRQFRVETVIYREIRPK